MFDNKWIDRQLYVGVTKENAAILDLVHIDQPSTSSSSHTSEKVHKFDFDLFSNSWGNFELEEWIITNEGVSWNPKFCVSKYISYEAVDRQMKSKLDRLEKTKNKTDELQKEMQKERYKEIMKLTRDQKVEISVESESFNPFNDPMYDGGRRRSRGLTYLENENLRNYQKSKGIPVDKILAKMQADAEKRKLESKKVEIFGEPIGKPTNKPVVPLPGQGPGYPQPMAGGPTDRNTSLSSSTPLQSNAQGGYSRSTTNAPVARPEMAPAATAHSKQHKPQKDGLSKAVDKLSAGMRNLFGFKSKKH